MRRATTIDHVLKYTGIFGGVQGLTMLMSVVRNKLATHLLGAAGIGLMGIYVTTAEFVSSASNFGIPFTAVRRVSELFEDEDDAGIRRFVCIVRTWCLWTALLAAAVCTLFAPLLWRLFFDNETSSMWSPALISPMVMATLVTGGEISILKGTRRLKRVAIISLLAAVALLAITIPLFWALGMSGIVLALDVTAIATMCIHLAFTLPLFPWHIEPFSHSVMTEGWQMIRTGIPYVLAAVATSAVAMAVPALILNYGSLSDVGFYRAAYALMVGYAGIVFTALEADFFPRLSSVNHDRTRRNVCINQQIQVCVALIGPFMIALAMMMPIVLRILYAPDFHVIEGMALAAVFYTVFRAVTTPIAYTALAHGDSRLFLAMELIYDVVSLALIAGAYRLWGLVGAGAGLSASALFDLILITTTYCSRYGFRMTRRTFINTVIQFTLVAAAVACCFLLPPFLKYVVCTILIAMATLTSLRSLRQDRHFPTFTQTLAYFKKKSYIRREKTD